MDRFNASSDDILDSVDDFRDGTQGGTQSVPRSSNSDSSEKTFQSIKRERASKTLRWLLFAFFILIAGLSFTVIYFLSDDSYLDNISTTTGIILAVVGGWNFLGAVMILILFLVSLRRRKFGITADGERAFLAVLLTSAILPLIFTIGTLTTSLWLYWIGPHIIDRKDSQILNILKWILFSFIVANVLFSIAFLSLTIYSWRAVKRSR